MRKTIWIGLVLVLALFMTVPTIRAQQQSPEQRQQSVGWQCPWMSQGGQGGWFCPWCGRGTGRGMMSQRGYGMGHHRGQYAPCRAAGNPVTQDEAKVLLSNYLERTNNPNLKLGDIEDKGDYYQAQIVTKDGSLIDQMQVSKETGWFRSAY